MSDTIGKMDRRITIQNVTESRDSFGGFTQSWATYATRWASIKYTRANENYNAQRKQELYTILFTIRRDSTTKLITEKMRIQYEGNIYDIRSITERTDEHRRMYLTIEGENKGPDTHQ